MWCSCVLAMKQVGNPDNLNGKCIWHSQSSFSPDKLLFNFVLSWLNKKKMASSAEIDIVLVWIVLQKKS